MIARVVVLLIKHWPAYRNYMAAYSIVIRRQQLAELSETLQSLTESMEAIKEQARAEGFAACRAMLLPPEQETPDA